MSRLIEAHQPCKYCGSSDAYAIYDDSEHCFSCNKHIMLGIPRKFLVEHNKKIDGHELNLTDNIPQEYIQWLLKYRVFEADRLATGIKFDTVSQRLMLPLSGGAYQGRSNHVQPKYLTFGEKVPMFFGDGGTIVLVEDWLSAYRISKTCSALALLGTSVPLRILGLLTTKYNRIVLWLDPDEAGKIAMKKIERKLALLVPYKIQTIESDKDPKEYSDTEIKTILGL
jgi:hypothetical protein